MKKALPCGLDTRTIPTTSDMNNEDLRSKTSLGVDATLSSSLIGANKQMTDSPKWYQCCSCGWTGDETEFVDNIGECPECGGVAEVMEGDDPADSLYWDGTAWVV